MTRTTAKRPTRNDVAALAEVSGCTVSYVLSGRKDVVIAPATRTRVIEAARQLGYQPNHAARSLVTGSSKIVSLWAGKFSPYYAMVTNHLRAQVKQSGYQMLVSDIEIDLESLSVGTWSGDGVIALEYPEQADAYLKSHPEFRVPVISIGVYHREHGDYVGVDLYGGARKAVEHLRGLGCKRIAYVDTALANGVENDPRRTAYQDSLKEYGLATEEIVIAQPSRSEARLAIREYVAQHGCPEGLFCHNDDIAIGVYRGLMDLGIDVPSQVALVGCDGIEDTEYLERPITTIVQPVEAMCRMGWEFLQHRMADRTLPPQRHIFDTELIVRESSVIP